MTDGAEGDLMLNHDKQYESVMRRGLRIGYGEAPAVVIVDLQRYATDPNSPIFCQAARDVLDGNVRLLDAARAAGVPVIYITNIFHSGQEEAECAVYLNKFTGFKYFSEDSEWSQIAPEIAPHPGEVVVSKQMSSGFFQTNLARVLTTMRIDTTIMTGFATSGCLRATAVDALFHGFRPILPQECIADRSPDAHRQNLLDIGLRYADIVELDEIVEYIERIGGAKTGVPAATGRER